MHTIMARLETVVLQGILFIKQTDTKLCYKLVNKKLTRCQVFCSQINVNHFSALTLFLSFQDTDIFVFVMS